jgi:glutathione S-transferase
MQPTYKLHYFDGNGRAVNIRAILDYANANWEDNRISFADWPALKSSGKFEFGQMPVLELEGKQKTQTIAIEIFLARRFGLIGSTEEDEYQILNILSSREDYSKTLYGLIMPTEEQKTKREEIVKNLRENVFPLFLEATEKKYLANGKGKYFLGDKFSLADIFLVTGFTQLFESVGFKDLFSDVPSKFAPNVLELTKRIKENDLKNFFAKSYLHNSLF